jgi:energy-converting hydrogenase Eha subunit C
MGDEQEAPPVRVATVPSQEAGLRARHQLGRVLLMLALLDIGVVLLVVGLAVARGALGLTSQQFLFAAVGGVGLILAVRVVMAVRLRRRKGALW